MSTTAASLPNILLYDFQGHPIDSVSSEYEDSFSLEKFYDLIMTCESAKPKHGLIIARVATWDHKQPGREFYSYYHAHHLNKILFQTQRCGDKKLIHRLHVLNPLTNTDIVGEVDYFLVQSQQKSDLHSPEKEVVVEISPKKLEEIKRKSIEVQRRTSLIMLKTITPSLATHLRINSPQSPEPLPSPHSTDDTWLIKSAVIEGKPIQHLRKSSLPTPSSSGSLAHPRRYSSKRMSPLETVSSKEELFYSSPTVPQATLVNKIQCQGLDVKIDINNETGQPTQFSQEIPASKLQLIIPSTPECRRRVLSFHNSIAGKKHPTPVISPSINNFEARWIGSDNDFLESSRLRNIFKSNAVDPTENVLFEMPPTTETEFLALGLLPSVDAEAVNTRPTCCEQLVSVHPQGLSRMSRSVQFLHSAKCYLLALGLFGIMLFLILWTLFSGSYSHP